MLIVLYSFLFTTAVIILYVMAGCLLAGSGIVLLGLQEQRLKKAGLLLIAAALGLVLGLSLQLRLQQQANRYYSRYNEVSAFSGTVSKDSIPAGEQGFIHYLKIRTVVSKSGNYRSSAAGRVKVIVSQGSRYYTGQQLTITAGLRRITDDTENHFLAYARQQQITENGFATPVSGWRFTLLRLLHQRIELLGSPAAALFKALFLGAKEDLPPEITTGFEKTGTLHLLALSGLHVGIIYLLITLLLFPLPCRWLKILVGSLFVIFYLFLAGPRPSLLRASLMLLILGLNQLLHRQAEPLHTIALSGMLILFSDPLAAYSLSFQLSFLALLGIVVAGRKIINLAAPYLPAWLLAPLACSLGAQLATAPVVLTTFGILYPAGILVTLLLIPLVTAFLWGGIILLLLGLLPLELIHSAGALLMNLLYLLINNVTQFFSLIPGLELSWHPWYWALFLVAVFSLLLRRRQLLKLLKLLKKNIFPVRKLPI